MLSLITHEYRDNNLCIIINYYCNYLLVIRKELNKDLSLLESDIYFFLLNIKVEGRVSKIIELYLDYDTTKVIYNRY